MFVVDLAREVGGTGGEVDRRKVLVKAQSLAKISATAWTGNFMPSCTAANGREMVEEYPTEIDAGTALTRWGAKRRRGIGEGWIPDPLPPPLPAGGTGALAASQSHSQIPVRRTTQSPNHNAVHVCHAVPGAG